MDAVMLAAGVGERLDSTRSAPPKALLSFAGRSLLSRHIDILRQCGIVRLMLVVGHRDADIRAEVAHLGAADFVEIVANADYDRGSLVSLWCAKSALDPADGVLVMDADVLYHPHLIDQLVSSPQSSCVLMDRGFEPGDEPVKVGVRDGTVVEFGKDAGAMDLDVIGEWPGFLKLSPATARVLRTVVDELIAAERLDEPMEAAIRTVMRRYPKLIGWHDISGLPWIEIDFPEDVVRARDEILPRIEAPMSDTTMSSATHNNRASGQTRALV